MPEVDLANLHPVFRERVRAAVAATGTTVYSGARSTEEQARLYRDFRAGKGNPANPPGTSWHEYGDGIPGGSWALAVDFAEPYPHGFPGLIFPVAKEPWHSQPAEIAEPARVAGADKRLPSAPSQPPPPRTPDQWDDLFVPILA